MGWGSGTVEFPYLVAPLDAIKTQAQKDGTQVTSSTSDDTQQGASAAQNAEYAIVCINSDSGEGYITVERNAGDRLNLDPWHNGNDLVKAVAAVNKKTIVVIHSVGPLILEPYIDNPNVVAVVWAGLPGVWHPEELGQFKQSNRVQAKNLVMVSSTSSTAPPPPAASSPTLLLSKPPTTAPPSPLATTAAGTFMLTIVGSTRTTSPRASSSVSACVRIPFPSPYNLLTYHPLRSLYELHLLRPRHLGCAHRRRSLILRPICALRNHRHCHCQDHEQRWCRRRRGPPVVHRVSRIGSINTAKAAPWIYQVEAGGGRKWRGDVQAEEERPECLGRREMGSAEG